MTRAWTTPADIRAKVRRRWNDGTLLRVYAAHEPFPVIEVPLRGPGAAEIGADLGAAQEWVAALDAGRRGGAHYVLDLAPIGGRFIGRNELPSRARVTTFEQAWAVLGVAREVQRLEKILGLVSDEPVVREWVVAQPLKALAFGDDWPALCAAYRWLDTARESGKYLREISAPRVDTKFVERHRAVLAGLLGVPGSASAFLTGLGLQTKPEFLRMRIDPELGVLAPLTEVTAPVDQMRRLDVAVQTAVIAENEVTFLSLPVPPCGVVLWGKGFEVDRAGSLPWLSDADVHYWGDLDTHGFAILNQLRAWLPQSRSFLMDRETLLGHRDRWVSENSPTRARLDRLTAEESSLYQDLVSDRFGDRVRLEQERIDWTWAEQHFPYA